MTDRPPPTAATLSPPSAAPEINADFRSIVEAMSEGVAILLQDGTIAMVNESAAKLVGATPDQVIGHKLLDLRWHSVDEEGRTISHANHPALVTLRTGKPLSNVLMGVHRADRSIVWLSVNTRPLYKDGEKIPYAVIASYTNITPHFEHFDRMKREFVSAVSHELRTPITSIRGALGLIDGGAAGEVPDKIKELVKLAKNNSDRLMRLINDILDLEKIETGKLILHLGDTTPQQIVEPAIAEMQPVASQRGINLETDMEATALLRADRTRVIQVLINLLSNAIKFSDSAHTILVRALEDRSYVKFEVIDRGIGIDVSNLDKLFKRFSQLDSADNRKEGGTGIGLAIARAIVEQHGGKIGVESEPGIKTVFWFTIPQQSALELGKLKA